MKCSVSLRSHVCEVVGSEMKEIYTDFIYVYLSVSRSGSGCAKRYCMS